jgi:glycosyltransferase involved in cell wall biosynthesis
LGSIQNKEFLIDNLISVVIPTYNRQAMIIDALESVRKQSYRPIEVIIVDDGSTDKTADKVNIWLKNNSTQQFTGTLIQQENSGGNVARNRGINESNGIHIAFLDSDDLWLPNKLSKQIHKFTDDTVGAVYCGMKEVGLGLREEVINPKRSYPQGWLQDKLLVKDVTAPTSTYMIKKEVFQKVGCFDEQLQARQDWDMWIRIAGGYRIQCVPEVLVEYRVHSGVRTATNPDKELMSYNTIRKKYEEILKSQSIFTRLMARASFKKRVGRVNLHYKAKRRLALKLYLHSLLLWPFDFDSWAALLGFFMPKNLRQTTHRLWNGLFGKTSLAIRSH